VKKDTKYWVGFNLVKGIGPVRLERLLEYFGSLREAWWSQTYHLAAAGLNAKLCQQLVQIRKDVCLDELVEGLLAADIQILTWDDPAYPERLRQINQSPFVFYLK